MNKCSFQYRVKSTPGMKIPLGLGIRVNKFLFDMALPPTLEIAIKLIGFPPGQITENINISSLNSVSEEIWKIISYITFETNGQNNYIMLYKENNPCYPNEIGGRIITILKDYKII